VTDPSNFGWGSRLTFHGPLSAERADRLAAELTALNPATVVAHRGTGSRARREAGAVINCGAYQAFGSISDALKALRGLRTRAGECSLSTCPHLPHVVDAAVGAGFRPLRIELPISPWESRSDGLAVVQGRARSA
jgi:hypothetical protein